MARYELVCAGNSVDEDDDKDALAAKRDEFVTTRQRQLRLPAAARETLLSQWSIVDREPAAPQPEE